VRDGANGAGALTVAVPKGRTLPALAELFARAGVEPAVLLAEDRRLVREDPKTGLRFLLLKPDDVPTYVEYGTADLGVVGRDVLLEREYDLYAPVDLGIGRCRMMVAARSPAALDPRARALRVATKFPNVAAGHFARRGIPVEIVFVQGSVELAPLTGLADVIVDLVESGETLKQNDLVPIEHVCDVSSVVVANRTALKLRREVIAPILAALHGHAAGAPSPAGKPKKARPQRS
jgi:ATP phosphoribosyltransferase